MHLLEEFEKKDTNLGLGIKEYDHNSHNFQAKKHMFKSKMCVNVKVSHTTSIVLNF
jgi:hypothetical protein